MGSHYSKTAVEEKILQKTDGIPEFYYIDPKENAIFRVETESVTKHQLFNFQLYKKCAIGYLTDNNIVVAGGIRPTGELSKSVFYINTTRKYINPLASLKIPSMKGTLIHSDSKLYYIAPDLRSTHQIYSHKSWEIIKSNSLNLSNPAVYVSLGIIYFICGIKENKKPTKKIYYLDTAKDTEYKLLAKFVPIRLKRPILIYNKDLLILGGGKKITGEDNFSFIFHTTTGEKWNEIEGPGYKIEKSPGLCISNAFIWMSFGKFVMIANSQFQVFNVVDNRNALEEIKEIRNPEKLAFNTLKENKKTHCLKEEKKIVENNEKKAKEDGKVYPNLIMLNDRKNMETSPILENEIKKKTETKENLGTLSLKSRSTIFGGLSGTISPHHTEN